VRIAFLSIGGHIHTERWLGYFVQRGHEVHLITVQPEPLDGVTVHDLRSGIPFKPLHYAVGVPRLRRYLRRIDPDLFHVHFLQGYGYWSAFAKFRPMALTVWGDDVYEAPQRSALRRWLSRLALTRADLVTGDSRDILAAVGELGADPAKLHEINWGVDFDRFRPISGAAFRRRWDIAPDAPVLISLRSFSRPYYNIERILAMLPALLEREPRAVAVFAAYDGDAEPLRERAEALGVAASLRFVGRIPHAELPEALAAADVYLSIPSLDATSVSLLEAMACGKAIVASALPSNAEWIEDGVNGHLIEAEDAEALLARSLELLGDRERRERFGERCRDIVRARAGYRENMRKMEALCEELIARHPRARRG
jgi:glycosyltransferase involved in cell wall biosynthesis